MYPKIKIKIKIPCISVGMAENQVSRTCMSLAHPYGSCYKARRCCQRWNLAQNAAHWLDMTTDQNQYYIIALKPTKYSPPGIITSSTHQTQTSNQSSSSSHLMMLCVKGSLGMMHGTSPTLRPAHWNVNLKTMLRRVRNAKRGARKSIMGIYMTHFQMKK